MDVTDAVNRVVHKLGERGPSEAFAKAAATRTLEAVDWLIGQGEVWWADLGAPGGSEPGFRRPVAIIQGDAFNQSEIRPIVCVALTSNLKWADSPGNVL